MAMQAGTYNVNGRMPPAGLDLRPWLDASASQPDIVAVGFQEIVPLNAQNVVMGALPPLFASWWMRGFQRATILYRIHTYIYQINSIFFCTVACDPL